ncbi:dethiobiotin synthase [Maridesulfovibrio sp.]|uniref:dethiobiotin synthase n=1 Tax=Maridesulfovibrio sp. TaxID=2795000 RepID=UPI002A18C8FE|nr:dethiobiotin synthase [Maridesulfovibrio sp.]
MSGFFITGTGTDVGKTVVTAALARFFAQAGKSVLPVKPVQSGGIIRPDGRMDSPDGEVYKAAGAAWNPDLQCPFIFEPACSPHLAASLSGSGLDVDEVAARVRAIEAETGALLLVEGAGGIMVPLNDRMTMLDLMRALEYPVILAAENKLGGINEVLLSVAALRQAKLEIAGIIMTSANGPAPSEYGMAQDNIRCIESFSGVRVLGSIPHIQNWDHNNPGCWAEVDNALSSLDI